MLCLSTTLGQHVLSARLLICISRVRVSTVETLVHADSGVAATPAERWAPLVTGFRGRSGLVVGGVRRSLGALSRYVGVASVSPGSERDEAAKLPRRFGALDLLHLGDAYLRAGDTELGEGLD
jgi:hypothetical protein